MATNSYLNAAISGATLNGLLPENLTLHEVVFTIRHVGEILRKINHTRHSECVNEIRSLLTAIILECEYLQPKQELCAPMQIITPCLWYWAIANTEVTSEIPKFHNIYSNEGWILKSFFDESSPFVIPPCSSFNALLQTLENYYKTVKPHFLADDKTLHYKISNNVLQWRDHKDKATEDQITENQLYTRSWLLNNKNKLVEVPELPPNWVNKDPIARPISFDEVIQKIRSKDGSEKMHTPDYTSKRSSHINSYETSNRSTSIRSQSEHEVYNRSPSIQSINEHETAAAAHETAAAAEVLYESSTTFKWRDTIKKKITNVIIARNKNTGMLEISEQNINPLLHCVAEVVVKENSVHINKV